MATIGLKDIFYAKVTEGTAGAPDTYGTPKRMAKGISADLTVEIAEAVLYADDSVDAVVKEFVSGELKLGVNDLTPEIQAELLGQTIGTDGVLYSSGDDEAPYFAVGFSAKRPGGSYRYVWLHKTKFAVPNEKYATKGNNIAFNTPELVGKFIKRDDGIWKADVVGDPTETVAKGWFAAVKEPTV